MPTVELAYLKVVDCIAGEDGSGPDEIVKLLPTHALGLTGGQGCYDDNMVRSICIRSSDSNGLRMNLPLKGVFNVALIAVSSL